MTAFWLKKAPIRAYKYVLAHRLSGNNANYFHFPEFPVLPIAVCRALASPPQQETCIRTSVTERMVLLQNFCQLVCVIPFVQLGATIWKQTAADCLQKSAGFAKKESFSVKRITSGC